MKNNSFRNWKNGFETVDGGQGGTPKKKSSAGKIPGIVALVVVLLILVLNSTYEIKE